MRRPRDEGLQPQGNQGVILNLTLSGDGVWNAIYSVQITVGKAQQSLWLSIDTGSSDIWIADTSCSSSACSDAHTSLYDPASAIQVGQPPLNLTYLRGFADGPIIWDNFTIGPYTIPAQAMVSASQVSNELLSADFVGLLGLALPKNSRIANIIPPTESDAPDGATFQQNIFGLTPIDTAPAQRFFGLSLQRPGSSRIPSLLTIGKHPGDLLPDFDPSKINFMDIIPSPVGDTYWRVSLDGITGWVDSLPKPVTLGASIADNNVNFPVAIIDTGGSLILTTRDIANGIYGAWGIGPGSDGNYYVPCTTPMNMTISLGHIGPIPIHPLDLTAKPPGNVPSLSDTCVGIIQASDQLDGIADMVLGVAFLRNVYAVLSSDPSNETDIDSVGNEVLSPRLGFIPLTDPTTALQEFHSVRVLGESLDPPNNNENSNIVDVNKSLSVGIIILIAIIGFFLACVTLFGVRWWILRRRYKDGLDHDKKTKNAYEMDHGSFRVRKPIEGFEEYKEELNDAESTLGSERTRTESAYIPDEKATQNPPEIENIRSPSPTSPPYILSTPSFGTDKTLNEIFPSQPPSSEPPEEIGYNDERHSWLHSRSLSTSSATASTFHEEFGMAGVGARNSVASATSSKGVRPRIQEDAYRSQSSTVSPPMTRLGDELGPIISEET